MSLREDFYTVLAQAEAAVASHPTSQAAKVLRQARDEAARAHLAATATRTLNAGLDEVRQLTGAGFPYVSPPVTRRTHEPPVRAGATRPPRTGRVDWLLDRLTGPWAAVFWFIVVLALLSWLVH